jgi:zeta-carotene desaturase
LEGATVRVRKEQHATFVPDRDSGFHRPEPGPFAPTQPGNLWLCGDWTATGFPATLEGAARSAEAMLRAWDRAAR